MSLRTVAGGAIAADPAAGQSAIQALSPWRRVLPLQIAV
jgi:hypothetical protein